jgi:hypothetical protein
MKTKCHTISMREGGLTHPLVWTAALVMPDVVAKNKRGLGFKKPIKPSATDLQLGKGI